MYYMITNVSIKAICKLMRNENYNLGSVGNKRKIYKLNRRNRFPMVRSLKLFFSMLLLFVSRSAKAFSAVFFTCKFSYVRILMRHEKWQINVFFPIFSYFYGMTFLKNRVCVFKGFLHLFVKTLSSAKNFQSLLRMKM